MNDPHVVSLRYSLKMDEDTSYRSPPAIAWETEVFRATLESGVLFMEMKEHHATAGDAMAAVTGSLRSWEIDVALRLGRGSLRFEYEDAKIIDRNPPSPGSPRSGWATLQARATATAVGTSHVARARYPDPPQRFAAAPLVETMWKRFERFLDGKEPLTSMAYFCLTVIEGDAGSRKDAAAKYNVDLKVLSELGRLTSAVGDEETGRKYDRSGSRSHTSREKNWIEEAVKILVRRVGEYAADHAAPMAQIVMSDLPSL